MVVKPCTIGLLYDSPGRNEGLRETEFPKRGIFAAIFSNWDPGYTTA